MASYLWVRVHPPKDKSTLEGFVASRFGWRLYRHFFKTQSEKVWGVPVHRDPGRLGRAAHQGPLAVPGRLGGDEAEAVAAHADEVEAGHEPDRGVQLPEVRPRDDVGALRRDRHRAGHEGRRSIAAVTKVEHADGRAVAVTAVTDGVPTRYDVHRRDLVDADRRAAAGDGPARAGRRPRRGRRAALPRLHHGRARRARGSTASPTTGSTSTTRTSRSAASRTSAGGRRTW